MEVLISANYKLSKGLWCPNASVFNEPAMLGSILEAFQEDHSLWTWRHTSLMSQHKQASSRSLNLLNSVHSAERDCGTICSFKSFFWTPVVYPYFDPPHFNYRALTNYCKLRGLFLFFPTFVLLKNCPWIKVLQQLSSVSVSAPAHVAERLNFAVEETRGAPPLILWLLSSYLRFILFNFSLKSSCKTRGSLETSAVQVIRLLLCWYGKL